MEIQARHAGEVLVVGVEGELDAYWAEEAKKQLWAFLEQGNYRLVLDLSQLNYMSSAGLRVLHQLQQRLTGLRGSLVLAALQPFVLSVFQATGFDRAFLLCDQVDQAVAAATPETPSVDIGAATDTVTTPSGTFRFGRSGRDNGSLRVTGQADDFLYSRATLGQLSTVGLPSLGYSLGVGALGEHGPGLLDRLGEILSVPGAVYWLPGDGRQVPDFLVAGAGSGELPVHLLYSLALEGSPQFTAHFLAGEPEGADGVEEGAVRSAGAQLADVSRDLVAWAAQTQDGYSGVVGLAMRADIGELWEVGLKRSPRAEHAPANGRRISHRENLRDWLNFPTDPAFANHTLLAVGVLIDRARARFPEEMIRAAFGSIEEGDTNGFQAHYHGAAFGFVPEMAGGADLAADVGHIVEQGELVSVGHLLSTTRLRKAAIGLWIPQSP